MKQRKFSFASLVVAVCFSTVFALLALMPAIVKYGSRQTAAKVELKSLQYPPVPQAMLAAKEECSKHFCLSTTNWLFAQRPFTVKVRGKSYNYFMPPLREMSGIGEEWEQEYVVLPDAIKQAKFFKLRFPAFYGKPQLTWKKFTIGDNGDHGYFGLRVGESLGFHFLVPEPYPDETKPWIAKASHLQPLTDKQIEAQFAAKCKLHPHADGCEKRQPWPGMRFFDSDLDQNATAVVSIKTADGKTRQQPMRYADGKPRFFWAEDLQKGFELNIQIADGRSWHFPVPAANAQALPRNFDCQVFLPRREGENAAARFYWWDGQTRRDVEVSTPN